ncbi:MAG: hypothetical protein JWP72_3299 [Massilia sp.]|jgi:hypothetical protein|nr:hypothetical protein [Massilia sp.]
MSFVSTLVQFSIPVLSLAEAVCAAIMLGLVAGLLMFFRPLLQGIRRALILAVRARLGPNQRA